MTLLRVKNRGIALLATAFPALGRRLAAGYHAEESAGGIPWTPVTKPLSASTIALVTTSGVHHRDQPPFDVADPDGDPTFRELDLLRPVDTLTVTHDYYDHRDAGRDINIILPVERLAELAALGEIGGVARRAFSFMGHITGPHLERLKRREAPRVAALLRESCADAVLLTPV
jgi:D-proline reductase (dithiol) PrdB